MAKKELISINENERLSIVYWNENDISVQHQHNMFPYRDPHWRGREWITIEDEKEFSSTMELYGYVRENFPDLI